MRSSYKWILGLVLLIASIGFLYGTGIFRIGMQHGSKNHKHGAMEKEKIYICPMHPQIQSKNPNDTCPICGMDLVDSAEFEEEAEAEEASGGHVHSAISEPESHTGVKVSEKKQQLIGVKLAKVEKKKLFKTVSAPGRIAFDPELYTAQSEYLEALRQWSRVKNSPLADVKRSTREMIDSAKIRLKVLGLSVDQIKALGRKGRQSEGLLLSEQGQDNWVYADVFEVDLPQIEKGLSAEISASFLQGKVLAGEVVSVDQVINPKTRTAKVRIKIKNTQFPIRPESYVNVKILAPQGEHLSVPTDALMDTGKETFVFVKKLSGEFVPHSVSVLLETSEDVAIASGVEEGAEVVVGGNFMLDSESRLKAVLKSGASGGHNH